MAYDDKLADRVRRALGGTPGLDERRMFGGLAFLVNGNMCCGVMRSDLIVRVPRDGTGSALEDPHARPFDFTGKPMRGFVVVLPAGLAGRGLARWVKRGLAVARALPPK